MPRADFEQQLKLLLDEALQEANAVEKAIHRAIDALKRRDLDLSRRVIEEDDFIDRKRYEIEERCADIIATQQPMARDLRAIITLLHISVELERMGDYAEGIAKISLMMGNEPPLKPLIDIPRMADKSVLMMRDALDALVSRDQLKAQQVIDDDDMVDELYDQVYRELLFFMLQDPDTVKRATYLLWVAHDVERIADRATNIAERVIYSITGKMPQAPVSTY